MNPDHSSQPREQKRPIMHSLLGLRSEQQYVDLQQERDALLAANESLSEQLQQQSAVMTAEIANLTFELNGLRTEKASIAETVRAQHLDLHALKGQLEEAHSARDALSEQCVAASAEKRSLTDTVGRQTGDIERALAALAARKTELEQLGAKIVRLQNSLESRDRAGNTLEALRGEMKILEDRRNSLCTEIKAALGQIGQSGIATGRPAHDIATLVNKVLEVRSSADALNKQRAKIATEIEGLERKVDKTSARLLATEDTLAKRKSACEEKRQQVTELQTTSTQLKGEIKGLEATFAERKRQLDEEYARDAAALADLKQSMLKEIEQSRKEQEASLPEARLQELETREEKSKVLFDEAERRKGRAESRLAQAKEEAQQIRDQANKILQRARAKVRDLASEAQDMMATAKAKSRDVAKKRRELASMPDKVKALSEANRRLKEIIAKQKQGLQAAGGKSELNRTIRELERDVRKLAQANEKLTEKLEKEREHGHSLAVQVKTGRVSTDGGFLSGYQSAQEWMLSCGSHSLQHEWSRNVVTLGSGPFPDHLLDNELRRRKHVPCLPGVSSAEVMIVGRVGCAMSKIEEHIRCMEGEKLRIYSQEMAVLAMITGADPFDAEESALMEMGRSHPVLAQLIEGIEYGWQWPFLPSSGNDYFDEDQPIVHLPLEVDSPLAVMGYRVGKVRGLGVLDRQEILRAAFTGKIPSAMGMIEHLSEYMEQWGRPKTSQRLWRMAKHLSGLISYNRKKPTWHQAIDDWEEDLLWMKKELYPNIRFKFRWPAKAD